MRASTLMFPLVLLLAACKHDPEPATDTDDTDVTGDTDTGADTDTDTDTDTEEPEPERATFADASADQRVVAIEAALGIGPALGFFSVMQAEFDVMAALDGGERSAVCPAIEVLANDPVAVRYSGEGCTGASGSTYSGSAEAYNVSIFTELLEIADDGSFDFEGPMKLVFDDFALGGTGMDLTFDGTYEQSSLMYGEDYTATADLVSGLDGQVFGLQLTEDCTYEGDAASCAVRDGGEGSVEGLGAFDVAGTVSLVAMKGVLVLTGDDEMRVDFDHSVDGCAPVTIDGVPAEPFCYGEPDPQLRGASFAGIVDRSALPR